MPLQQAQLGQLPYMNLARYVPERAPIEPAWHKALTAFLVNTSANTGKDLVSNALAKDYSGQASAMGLPGAPAAGTPPQGFWSQVLHGPDWDKQQLQQGVRDKGIEDRLNQQDRRMAQQLGISQDELTSLNKYREGELAARQKEQGNHEADRQETTSYHKGMLDAENRRITDEQSYRQTQIDPTKNPEVAARIAEQGAQTANYNRMSDPTFVARSKMEQLRMTLGDDVFNRLRKSMQDDVPGGQPSNNNSISDFFKSGSQTVPGSQGPLHNPDGSIVDPNAVTGKYFGQPGPGNIPQTTPSAMPPTVQNLSPTDLLNAREAANRNTSAGTSSQMGQSQQMAPAPVEQTERGYPVTQPQALMQHVGQTMSPSDLMSLVNPPQTPNSPTSAQFSTPTQMQLPTTLDPETMRKAALLAKLLGTAGGMGGTPAQGGSGGLPLGYG